MSERRYTQEEVDAILATALERRQSGISHEDLVAAAQEVGIKPAQIEAASRRVSFESQAREIARRRTEKRARDFKQRARGTAVLCAFLFGINVVTGGTWAVWAILPLVFVLAMAWVRSSKEEDIDAIADQLEAEEEARLERERRARQKEKGIAQKAGAALGSVVGMAVDELLHAAETAIRDSREQRKSKGRFGEYVSNQKGDSQRQTQPGERPRGVRVKETAEPAWDDDEYTEEELADALEELERSL